MTVTNNIYQKQIKYHVFNAVTNSELTKLVPVFPTSIKKVNTSFKKCLADMGTGIIGGPHDFLPPTSDRSDEFQKLCNPHLNHNPNLNLNPNINPNLTLALTLTLTLLLSYPHGNKMKGYGSCTLFITISDFHGPPK